MAYYEHNVTGKRSWHPKSGIGDSLNATEIGEDGHAVKPKTSLAPSKEELREATKALKNLASSAHKTTGTKAGDTNKEGGTN
jgi:hypothetical protein